MKKVKNLFYLTRVRIFFLKPKFKGFWSRFWASQAKNRFCTGLLCVGLDCDIKLRWSTGLATIWCRGQMRPVTLGGVAKTQRLRMVVMMMMERNLCGLGGGG